ncbi:MAG: alpha/beta hydrolase [Candidatus Hermodarchaeota archaeon]|nr:alpha/beta hydrolase [Candidatus Hermodarchaeota archaeon]
MPFYQYDSEKNRRIHYKVQGSKGPRLLLLHSSMSSLREWSAQLPLAQDVILTLIDLPGHGESDPIEESVTVPNLVNVVSCLLKGLDLIPVIPVGHSIGGAVAMQFALDFPSKVQALILIGTGAKLGVYPAILEGLRLDYDRAINLTIGQMAFAKRTDPKLVEGAKHEALACPPAVSLADFQACNAFDARERLDEITVPTLILVGAEDQLTPPKWSQYLNEHISNSRLEIIPGAGHFVQQERPQAVNQAILTFLVDYNLG